MPTYKYECPVCEESVELVQKLSEKKAPTCERDNVQMESIIQRSSFSLKGGGWSGDGYQSDSFWKPKKPVRER